MTIRYAKSVTLILTVLLTLGIFPAHAQIGSLYEIHGGYSFLRTEGLNLAGGFTGGLTLYPTETFGLVGEMSFNSGEDLDFFSFLFGPRYAIGRPELIVPYIQFLIGAGHGSRDCPDDSDETCSRTQLAVGFGGGVDIELSEAIYFRALQFDYLRQMGDADVNQGRFSTGLVFHFGY